MQIPNEMLLKEVYGETEKSSQRFEKLAENYEKCFQSSQMEFFSAPGRTEIVGNHTDHNGGKVIAASINMDTIGAAFPNDSKIVEIVSEGYEKRVVIDVTQVDKVPKKPWNGFPGCGNDKSSAGIWIPDFRFPGLYFHRSYQFCRCQLFRIF